MRLGVVCDYLEEDWLSMDICAQMLAQNLPSALAPEIVRPAFRWRLKYLRKYLRSHFNGDRFLNRFVDYPRYLKSHLPECDVYHVVDHSYGHLVHSLPAARTGVFCHDLKAFESLLEPETYPRSWGYQRMSAHLLKGLQKAAIVFHTTQDVRSQIERYQLVDPDKLVAAPLGVSPEYQPVPLPPTDTILKLQSRFADRPYLLHVGSCVPRKRIDLLLDIFAKLRRDLPELYLVKAGGEWSSAQQEQIASLGVGDEIVHLTNLPNAEIAQLYQHAALVMLTSADEGFGMPVIEALACGAIVLATDLPVLREVGGNALLYAPLEEISTWCDRALTAITTPALAPDRQLRLDRAALYSWENHARTIAAAYQRLVGG